MNKALPFCLSRAAFSERLALTSSDKLTRGNPSFPSQASFSHHNLELCRTGLCKFSHACESHGALSEVQL